MARRKWGQDQYVEDGIYATAKKGVRHVRSTVTLNFRDADQYYRIVRLLGAKSWRVDGVAVSNPTASEGAGGELRDLPREAIEELHLENWVREREPMLLVLWLLLPGVYERVFEELEYDFG